MTSSTRRRLLALAALLPLPSMGWATPASTPAEFVREIGSRTVGILADADRPRTVKVAEVRAVLDSAFDLGFISRAVAGRHWRAMSPQQRAAYTGLFDRLISKIMAERISGYAGETFTLTRTVAIDQRDTLVGTAVRRPSGGPAWSIDWRVRDGDAGLRLIDVVVEGISLVLTQRAEADGIVQQAGLDGLLDEMRRRSATAGGTIRSPAPPPT